MLSLEKIYRIDPILKDLPEKEVLALRDELYKLGELALESWEKQKSGSKNPKWLLPNTNKDIK